MRRKLIKLMTNICLICTCSMLLIGCQSNKATITYEFSGEEATKAGYAEGTVTFTAKKIGVYNLYWSNNTEALEDYYEIEEVNITEENTEANIMFGYHTAIPAGATKIIAVEKEKEATVDNAVAVFDIPVEKQLTYHKEDAIYTFNSYSDIHIDEENGVKYQPIGGSFQNSILLMHWIIRRK